MNVITLVSNSEYCVAYAFDTSNAPSSDVLFTFDLNLKSLLLARSYSISGKQLLTFSGERLMKANKLSSSTLTAPVEIIILIRKRDSSGTYGFRL